jgi:hypothetical protein
MKLLSAQVSSASCQIRPLGAKHFLQYANSVASVRKRTIPTERPPLVSEVSANVTNPYSRILGFLDRSRYYFFQVAPQLYSRG